MSERSPKLNKNEDIFFSSENSMSQGEIDNLKQNLVETDLTNFFKINIYKMLKAKDTKERKSKSITEDYFKDHEQINEVKYNMFMIIFNDCKYNEEYSGAINQNENYFDLKRLVIQNCHVKGNILIPDKKQYSFIPYKRGTQDILFPYNNGTIKILIEKKMNLMINGKAIEGLTEKEFISKTNIIMPELERKRKERVIKSKSDKKSSKKKKNLSDVKSEKPYNFLHQIEQNNIVNDESNYKKEKHLLIKNFPKPLDNIQNTIEDEKLNYKNEENVINEKTSKNEKDKKNDLSKNIQATPITIIENPNENEETNDTIYNETKINIKSPKLQDKGTEKDLLNKRTTYQLNEQNYIYIKRNEESNLSKINFKSDSSQSITENDEKSLKFEKSISINTNDNKEIIDINCLKYKTKEGEKDYYQNFQIAPIKKENKRITETKKDRFSYDDKTKKRSLYKNLISPLEQYAQNNSYFHKSKSLVIHKNETKNKEYNLAKNNQISHLSIIRNQIKNHFADYIGKKDVINRNKNYKCDKNVNLSTKNPYSAPLKDIISSNETENSNDSMKEVLGDTIYIKKDENTYTRYIYTNQYTKEVDGIYTKHKEIDLNINKEIALNDLQKGIVYKNDNDLKIHIIYKNFVGEKIKKDRPFILEIKKNFKLVEILEQIALDSKILDNIKIKTDNISPPRFIIGVLCNYSKIGIEKEMEQLNQIYINNPNETKLEHLINVIKDCKINVIVGIIQNQKINDYRLDIEDYIIKDADNNSAMRVDIKYMYRKICNEELDVQKFNDIIAKNKNKYKSLTFEKKIGYIQHQKKIMEINEQYEKEKEKLQEENKKLQKMLEDEKKKREELEEKIKKLTGETENNKIE